MGVIDDKYKKANKVVFKGDAEIFLKEVVEGVLNNKQITKKESTGIISKKKQENSQQQQNNKTHYRKNFQRNCRRSC